MKLKEVYQCNGGIFDFNQLEEECLNYSIVFCGNNRYTEIGDELAIRIIKGEYEDEEVGYEYAEQNELKKVFNKEFEHTVVKGYSQCEWQEVFYDKDIPFETIQQYGEVYFGYYKVFESDDGYTYIIPDSVLAKGKKAVQKFVGLYVSSIQVAKEVKTIVYEEVE